MNKYILLIALVVAGFSSPGFAKHTKPVPQQWHEVPDIAAKLCGPFSCGKAWFCNGSGCPGDIVTDSGIVCNYVMQLVIRCQDGRFVDLGGGGGG